MPLQTLNALPDLLSDANFKYLDFEPLASGASIVS